MWRDPNSDFVYRKAWEPVGEDAKEQGRSYLTNASKHAQEVHRDQMGGRRLFLDRYGYPDGYDGITYRQFLEALSRVQGGLSQGQLAAASGGFARWQSEAMGCKPKAPDFDDSWCVCGLWVYASTTSCVCGFPTGRNRPGDWRCTGCFKHNYGGKGKGAQWCKRCGKIPVSEGILAFGDDTTDRGTQQLFLLPRMVEKSRPVRKTAELYGGSKDWEESYRLKVLRGWDVEEEQAGPSVNFTTVYRKYMEDQSALWTASGAAAWDGIENPCWCRSFMYAHFHMHTGKHLEGAKVPAEEAIPFWERVLQATRKRAEQEEADYREEDATLREAVAALEEGSRNAQEACEEAAAEMLEATEEVRRQAQDLDQVSQGDNLRRTAAKERSLAAAEEYLQQASDKSESEEAKHQQINQSLEEALSNLEAQGGRWKKHHEIRAEEEERVTSQLDMVRKENDQEARESGQTGKKGSPSGSAAGQGQQPRPGPGDVHLPGKEYVHKGAQATTLEEAEEKLVEKCVQENLRVLDRIQEAIDRRERLASESAWATGTAQEQDQLKEAWKEASDDAWKLQAGARQLEISHMDQAKELRERFSADPSQAPDIAAATRKARASRQKGGSQAAEAAAEEEAKSTRKLEKTRRDMAEEIELLEEEEREADRQSMEASRQATEAVAAAADRASHLRKLREQREEVQQHKRDLQAGIVADEEAKRTKEEAARVRAAAKADE
jgi:hypothetical protein